MGGGLGAAAAIAAALAAAASSSTDDQVIEQLDVEQPGFRAFRLVFVGHRPAGRLARGAKITLFGDVERLGTPEGELALAEAVIYLACAAKSNAVYTAYNAARAFIAEDGSRPVPLRLAGAGANLALTLGAFLAAGPLTRLMGATVKMFLTRHLRELSGHAPIALLASRYAKFRQMGRIG